MVVGWSWAGRGLVVGWSWAGRGLGVSWLWAENDRTAVAQWSWGGRGLVVDWSWASCRLSSRVLSFDGLTTLWFFVHLGCALDL